MKIEEMLNMHCADCLEFMKDIPDKSIDLTVIVQPYDNLRDYNGYTFDFEGIAKELYRITKRLGSIRRLNQQIMLVIVKFLYR